LYDNFEYTGTWFLPESKEKQVIGTLKYSKDRFVLETIGSITSDETDFISELVQGFEPPKEIPIILGISTNGTKITITRCHKSGSHPVMNGLTTYRYTGYDLYLGWNFDREEDILFSTMKISYSNFNEWYPMSGISTSFVGGAKWNVKLDYSSIDPVEAKIDDDFRLVLDIVPRFSKSLIAKEFKLNEDTFLTIKSAMPKHNNEFLKMSRCYSYFLMLAMAHKVYPITITGSTKDYTVSIFPAMIMYEDIPKVPSHHMLFLYHEISEGFQTFIQLWKKLWDTHEEVITTYFSTLLNAGLSTIEIQFLRIAFVLEAYHRKKFPDVKIPFDKTYGEMIIDMKSRLSDNIQALEFIERNRKKPMFVNFKQRLEKLVDICPDVFKNPEVEKLQFVTKVLKTRNHLAHISEESDENVVDDPFGLIYLTHEMMALMEGCLLAELHFSPDKLKDLIIKNRNIRNYAKEHPIN